MHETSINQKNSPSYLKDNRLSFQEMYFKSLLSLIFIAISRDKDKRFSNFFIFMPKSATLNSWLVGHP